MRCLHVIALAAALLLAISDTACSSAVTSAVPTTAPATVAPNVPTAAPAATVASTAVPTTAPAATAASAAAPAATAAPTAAPAAAPTADIVVYASDLQKSALTDEFDFADDPASPEGKLIALPNTGDKLNAPPEDDPHVTFPVQVQADVPYHCWIHMKVGAPKGVSQANRLYVQFSDAVDKSKQPVFTQGTGSFMTAQGPEHEGWTWVGCASSDPEAPGSLIYFRISGKVTARLQAGMEGVGFDEFLLSPARFLEQPPTEAVVQK